MKDHISDNLYNRPFLVEEKTDTCWKALTENGNMFFHEGNFQQAGKFYESALQEAEDIFLSAQIGTIYPDVAPAPMLVSSATNLAENHMQKGDGRLAFNTLSTTVGKLCTALNDPAAPTSFLEECAYHLGHVVVRLATLMRSLGASRGTITIEIEKTKTAFLNFSSRQASVKH